MLRIDITYPYAHDLILQAHDIVIEQYPDAVELRMVEAVGIQGFSMDGSTIYYDPEIPMHMCLNHLVEVVRDIYVSYYLTVKVPRCSLLPVPEYPLQH